MQNKNFSVYILGLFILSITKLIFSYFIPLQFIPAPHDDYLFYRLAESIANLKWLGVFDQTTLIKGFSYPFFLSLSIFFSIPLRLIEALLLCIAGLYFVAAMRKISNNLYLSLVLYAAIIFSPLQYGLIDYRLLRDMIYFPLILIFISAIFYIYLQADKKDCGWKIRFVHPAIFGLSFFFYWHTREEGAWIIPSALFFLIFVFYKYFQEDNIKELCKKFAVVILVFGFLQGVLVALNSYKYRSFVVTIFKESNFQSGYASLHRLNSSKSWYEDISPQEWKEMFSVSPAVAELRPFVEGDGYRFWANITCDSMHSNGYRLDQSGCPNVMPPGNVQFALMDALFQIGYRKPAEISQYMARVTYEIDTACDSKKLKCKSKPPFMLSRNIFEEGIPLSVLWANVWRSTGVMATPKPILLSTFSSYLDLNMVPKMRGRLGGYLFEPRDITALGGADKLDKSGISQFFISSHPYIEGVYDITSYIYSWFMSIAWVLLFPAVYLTLRERNPVGMVIGGFLIMATSRIFLISILDYYAMAPISPLYLMSGTEALFISEILSLYLIIYYWLRIKMVSACAT